MLNYLFIYIYGKYIYLIFFCNKIILYIIYLLTDLILINIINYDER